ncbi:hypothetical protein NTGM5_20015 [Candidatus Nitrotoga sp. M5]|nr:hypothetical protein NTGM5_20015 [Candidatus Nitrotoga sp. M5]
MSCHPQGNDFPRCLARFPSTVMDYQVGMAFFMELKVMNFGLVFNPYPMTS